MQLVENKLAESREQLAQLVSGPVKVQAAYILRNHAVPVVWECQISNASSLAAFTLRTASPPPGLAWFYPRPFGVLCFYQRQDTAPLTVRRADGKGVVYANGPVWVSVQDGQAFVVDVRRRTTIAYEFALQIYGLPPLTIRLPPTTSGRKTLFNFSERLWVSLAVELNGLSTPWDDFYSTVALVPTKSTVTVLTPGEIWGGNFSARNQPMPFGVLPRVTLERQWLTLQSTKVLTRCLPVLVQELVPTFFGAGINAPPVRQRQVDPPLIFKLPGPQLSEAVAVFEISSNFLIPVVSDTQPVLRVEFPEPTTVVMDLEQTVLVSPQNQPLPALLTLELTAQDEDDEMVT